MYQLSDYAYDLPEDRIAQEPSPGRSDSKLLCLDRETHAVTHLMFRDILSCLEPEDLLVVNNTRVVPARLLGRKKTGGKIEILIVDYAQGIKKLEATGFFECDCLIRASKRPKPGSILLLDQGVEAMVMGYKDHIGVVRFLNGKQFLSYLDQSGTLPLPPYIKRDESYKGRNDPENYQTVYASEDGAVAAPTAGLHFTEDLIARIGEKGIGIVPITLHVGYGTFVPVRVEDIREHPIHSEFFSISQESAERINAAKESGGRVIAVGTTSVRTLEYISDRDGRVKETKGVCDLFIYPGYQFKCVDAMITNFHLPESTLLMLVSAFYDREKILDAYKVAIENEYRFFSYGDAMFIR